MNSSKGICRKRKYSEHCMVTIYSKEGLQKRKMEKIIPDYLRPLIEKEKFWTTE